jgi:predicted RNase H-like HicB family nuclease
MTSSATSSILQNVTPGAGTSGDWRSREHYASKLKIPPKHVDKVGGEEFIYPGSAQISAVIFPHPKPRENPMETEILAVETGREDDGRWFALISALPGVMAYGESEEQALESTKALALEVAADCLRHGEPIPHALQRVFQAK